MLPRELRCTGGSSTGAGAAQHAPPPCMSWRGQAACDLKDVSSAITSVRCVSVRVPTTGSQSSVGAARKAPLRISRSGHGFAECTHLNHSIPARQCPRLCTWLCASMYLRVCISLSREMARLAAKLVSFKLATAATMTPFTVSCSAEGSSMEVSASPALTLSLVWILPENSDSAAGAGENHDPLTEDVAGPRASGRNTNLLSTDQFL
mmetsp:Transcript_35788/g.100664  ORF Transcript_35788/g.100664 Transcript_35788/m.100664 type:complete len:207 (-) Transcript_35788:1969-2589(-)